MMFLLLRLLPWAISGLALIVAGMQWRAPELFPWAWGCVLLGYSVSTWMIARKRLVTRELAERMVAPLLTLASIGSLWLLAESDTERLEVSLLFSGILWISLELFYLMNHEPSRYPVNGLSRFSVACVPMAGFALGILGLGLHVFVGVNPAWLFALFAVVFGLLLFVTSHPVATPEQSRSWAIAGVGFGLLISFLIILLPTSGAVAGAICALLFSIPMRARRYLYQPFPTRKTMMVEVALAGGLFLALVIGARWT